MKGYNLPWVSEIRYLGTYIINRLKLNVDKTQIIWIGTRQQLKKVVDADIVLNGHRIAPSPTVTCLGVNINTEH